MGTVEQGHSIQPFCSRKACLNESPSYSPISERGWDSSYRSDFGWWGTHYNDIPQVWTHPWPKPESCCGMAPSVQLYHLRDWGAACPDLSHRILGIRKVTSSLGLSSTTHPKLYGNSLQSSVWLQKKVEVNQKDVRCTYLEFLLMAATMRAVQPSLCLVFTSAPSSNNLERGEIWSGSRYGESTPSVLELKRESRMFYCAGTCSSTAQKT